MKPSSADLREENHLLRDIIERLVHVATGEIRHRYGDATCPDETNAYRSRDLACPACQIILDAEGYASPWGAGTPSRAEALFALALMAQQYLETMQDGARTGNLSHRFMTAGEQALDVLDRAGLVEEHAPETYRFTERGRVLLEKERFA